MNADASDKVLIRRHSAFNTLRQPLFYYSPESGQLEPAPTPGTEASGWLVDFEKVVSGAKRVIFFRRDGDSCVSLGRDVFVIGGGRSSIAHTRGILFSELKVMDEARREHVVKYITPWWRLIFDDGSHPDLQFPLEAFSIQYGKECVSCGPGAVG